MEALGFRTGSRAAIQRPVSFGFGGVFETAEQKMICPSSPQSSTPRWPKESQKKHLLLRKNPLILGIVRLKIYPKKIFDPTGCGTLNPVGPVPRLQSHLVSRRFGGWSQEEWPTVPLPTTFFFRGG